METVKTSDIFDAEIDALIQKRERVKHFLSLSSDPDLKRQTKMQLKKLQQEIEERCQEWLSKHRKEVIDRRRRIDYANSW